jgi:hypothetical protein
MAGQPEQFNFSKIADQEKFGQFSDGEKQAKIDESHEEALTINDEVNKRKELPENDERAKSDLAELAILERSNVISEVFSTQPEVAEVIKRKFRKEVLETGLTVYVDPDIAPGDQQVVDRFLNYLKNGAYKKDFELADKFLPDQYKRATQAEIPPILIHGATTSKDIATETTAGFTDKKAIRKNINIISSANVAPEDTFVHEYTHTLEPESYFYSVLYNEGLTTMVERRAAGVDPSDRFIESFKYWLKGEHSDHPLANAVSHDGKTFQVKFEQLFTADAQTMEPGSSDPYASTITKYHLMASFLDWYRQNRDEKLGLMTSEVYSPNYAELFKMLIQIYPDKVQLPEHPPMPEGSFDPMKPPPRSMSIPKRISTIPNELKFISTEVCRIGLPETGTDMAQAVQEIRQLSESGDEINLKAKFYELAEKARQAVKQIESDYNTFLTGKLSAGEKETAEAKDNSVTIKALEDEYNRTLLGRDAEGRFVDDFKEPTEQDAMRIVQMIEKSDANTLDLADLHFAIENCIRRKLKD